MLEHLGQIEAGQAIFRAIESVLQSPNAPRTPDLGGKGSTEELGAAIRQAL
jgi:tartrate dehydrogenase/decarboxylase/D-malate dehydrogenase